MRQWEKPTRFSPPSGAVNAGQHVELPELGEVFCDWLDVTFSPLEDLSWLQPLLSSVGVVPREGSYVFTEGGIIKHQRAMRWQRISCSGGSLAVLRRQGLFDELLRCMSQHSYKVTRLDAAFDLGVDAAPIVSGLWARYQEGLRLNQWNTVMPRRYEGFRFDGIVTGTFYAGHRKRNEITARVYDKQHEVYEHHKVDVGSRIRYELTVRTNQVTLRDVSQPAAVFWHYVSPALLDRPGDVSDWVPGNPYSWVGEKMPAVSVEDRLRRVVYETGDLNAALVICGDSLEHFEYLRKLVCLRISERASRLPDWRPHYGAAVA